MKRAFILIPAIVVHVATGQWVLAAQAPPAGPPGAPQPNVASPASVQPQPHASARMSGAPLGRLFFSPAERTQLDIARAKKPTAPPPQQQAAAEMPEPPPAPQTVSYGGIVRRSDGKAMLWINNRLVEEKDALAGLNLKGKVRPDGAMTVQVPQTGGSINVKVGQSVELQTGKVAEVRRPAEEPKAPPADGSAPASDAKGAAPDPATPAAAAKGAAPAAKPESEAPQKPGTPANVGLKLDLGGRTLKPAEEQQLRKQ